MQETIVAADSAPAERTAVGRAPAPVKKLAHYVVHSTDPSRIVDYYEQVLGLSVSERSGDATYLTTGAEHHCVVVARGSANDGRAGIGFQLAVPLELAAQALGAAEVGYERRTDPEPGVAEALVLPEPWSGTPLSLFAGQANSGQATAIGRRPTKLGHIASYVPELAPAQAFYCDVLGFRWSDTLGDFFTFLRCNHDHHAINLMASTRRRGLFHSAFEMRDMLHLKDALDHLARHGYHLQWGPGRHGPGHNIFTYHKDPDGNHVELFTEIDIIADETTAEFEPRPWHETWPQGPKMWNPEMIAANKWGPISPEMMEH